MIDDLQYKASKIADIINGILVGDDCEIRSITLDSKERGKDTCFFAIKGENFDGHDYVEEAILNGAKLIIAEKTINTKTSVIYVEDVKKALGLLGKAHKGNTTVIGVTGSVGKTTVKNMIISVLSEEYSVCGTEKNYNNEIGAPLTLLSIKNEDYCVVEMGMRGLGQIDWLAYICEPKIAIITNCTDAHLEKLKSRENIYKAKTEILNYNPEYAIFPYDKWFLSLNKNIKNITFLGNGGNNFVANVTQKDDFMEVELNNGDKYTLNSIFKCNAYNSLIAYTVGKYLNISNEKIFRGLLKYKKETNREDIIVLGDTTIINDCYNASSESMKNAISSASNYAKSRDKRLYFMLGDMLELGNESGEMHIEIGELCRKSGAVGLYLYGKYKEYTKYGFGSGEFITDSDECINNIADEIKGGVLLVKASRRLNFEIIIDELKEKLNE